MSETVYILGPMRGIRWFNFQAFDDMRDRLQIEHRHIAISPADIDRESGFDAYDLPQDYDWNKIPDRLDIKQIIKRDLEAIQRCTAYVCLDRWEKSTGAMAEKSVCDWLGLKDLTEHILGSVEKPTESTNKLSICEEAQSLTTGERAAAYGHPIVNFTTTANLINARFGTAFTPDEIAEIMILVKIARQVQAKKRDNMVDIAGYANCIGLIEEERERRKAQ